MRTQPFVLKCPECTAPSEAYATHCRYCKVPLQWRPVISLGSMEDYREPERRSDSDEDGPVLAFGPQAVAPDAVMVFQMIPQIPFRPVRMILAPSCADRVQVEDIRVGNRSQFVSPTPIGGWAFSPANMSAKLTFDTVNVGQFLIVCIRNITPEHLTVSGIFRGTTFELPIPPRSLPALVDPPYLFSSGNRGVRRR